MTLATERAPAWSKSQMAALRECRRKYFFNQTAQHPELKNLKNRFLWTGSIVHETVGQLLKELRQGQSPVPVDQVVNTVKERMRGEFKASLQPTSPSMRLFEHEYKRSLSQETWLAQWNTVEQSIRRFMSSAWFDRLSKIGPECWKAVDEVVSFDVDGIKAYVKIDCGIEVEGQFFIMDWKSSSVRPTDEAGLLVAALYAHEVWGADPSQITALSVSLMDGKSLKAGVSEDALMETFLKIQEEAAVLESEKCEEGTDPFSLPAASLDTCERCNFQRVCRPASFSL